MKLQDELQRIECMAVQVRDRRHLAQLAAELLTQARRYCIAHRGQVTDGTTTADAIDEDPAATSVCVVVAAVGVTTEEAAIELLFHAASLLPPGRALELFSAAAEP